MTVFGDYASYYDLLYADKDYFGETQFIDNLIKTYAPSSNNILELGCGTGNHASLLAQLGYHLHGVDLSQEMLQIANERVAQMPQEVAQRTRFSYGDIRQIRLGQIFDVVLSLFHVISYQTTNSDLVNAFTTIKSHLKPEGISIFDLWYGPTVLTDPPSVRIKRLENDLIQATRIAEPVIYPNDNCVDVNYHIFIKDKNTEAIKELKETHKMRYLFKSEIQLILNNLGMEIIDYREWLTNKEAGLNTWGVYFVVKNLS